MALSDYIARITEVARKAKSESKLEGEFNQILKECLHEFGIPFDPHVNETLKSERAGSGLSFCLRWLTKQQIA